VKLQRHSLFAVVFVAVGVIGTCNSLYERVFTTGSDRAMLWELMHVPDGAEVVHSSTWSRRGGASIELTVQLSPADYAAYEARLNDPSVWSFQPFDLRRVSFDGTLAPQALHWFEGTGAWGAVSYKERIGWLHWGREQEADGVPLYPAHSLCMAVEEGWFSSTIVQCRDQGRSGPDAYLRAMLVEETQQLFIIART